MPECRPKLLGSEVLSTTECALCGDFGQDDLGVPISYVRGAAGSFLCNYCCATLLGCSPGAAAAFSFVGSAFSRRDAGGAATRATHWIGNDAADVRPGAWLLLGGPDRDYSDLRSFFERQRDPEGVRDAVANGMSGACSFCLRSHTETFLVYRTATSAEREATVCGDCLILACQLFQERGELPHIEVEFRGGDRG